MVAPPEILALRRWKQEGQEFKVILEQDEGQPGLLEDLSQNTKMKKKGANVLLKYFLVRGLDGEESRRKGEGDQYLPHQAGLERLTETERC